MASAEAVRPRLQPEPLRRGHSGAWCRTPVTLAPICLWLSAAETPASWPIFAMRGKAVGNLMARFGGKVKKLLACLFLLMRISQPGTTLAGVFDTSSPP